MGAEGSRDSSSGEQKETAEQREWRGAEGSRGEQRGGWGRWEVMVIERERGKAQNEANIYFSNPSASLFPLCSSGSPASAAETHG